MSGTNSRGPLVNGDFPLEIFQRDHDARNQEDQSGAPERQGSDRFGIAIEVRADQHTDGSVPCLENGQTVSRSQVGLLRFEKMRLAVNPHQSFFRIDNARRIVDDLGIGNVSFEHARHNVNVVLAGLLFQHFRKRPGYGFGEFVEGPVEGLRFVRQRTGRSERRFGIHNEIASRPGGLADKLRESAEVAPLSRGKWTHIGACYGDGVFVMSYWTPARTVHEIFRRYRHSAAPLKAVRSRLKSLGRGPVVPTPSGFQKVSPETF